MEHLFLPNTTKLMEQKHQNGDFESFALYVKFGDSEFTLTSENVNEDTYFDIASCGKILVTSPLALQAVSEEKLSLESKLSEFFDCVPEDKKDITIKHILTHTSGIVRHSYVNSEPDKVAEEILSRPLAFDVGTDYAYSCSGMVLLGYVLEKVYGESLESLFERKIKKPLKYTRSKFNIRTDEPNAAICYHSRDVGDQPSPWDDKNIRILKTSAGSGGQFFTLSDIKKFTSAIMNKDETLYPKEIFDLAEMEHSPKCASESRGLGWLYVDEKYPQTGELFPDGSFGHCGHAGQSIFFNRDKDMCVVILSNATHCLNKKSDYTGYDYNIICQMRESIHNEILKDLKEQGLL